MAEALPFLRDLAVLLVVAALTTIVFHRLRQPVVLGYILAGVIVGPHTPPFPLVADVETIRVLGELGVIFLLFALGLEFNLAKLRKVGATATISGLLQAALMFWIGYETGLVFGLAERDALFLGAVVSISSTVIIVKVVEELGQWDEEWTRIAVGILLVEDVLAVLILTLLGAGAGGAEAVDVAAVAGRLALFVAAVLVLGLLVVPRLVTWVARFPVPEVLVVTVAGLASGLAMLGAALGLSPALGAFLAGALVAESPVAKKVTERMVPVRDLFTAIFFVAIGMLVDPALLVEHWALVAAVVVAVVVGKIASASFATFVTGHDVRTSLRVGFGLAQIGEFSFVIAAAAAAAGSEAPIFAVAVSVAAVTAFTTPYLIRHSAKAAAVAERLAPRSVVTFATVYGAWVRRLGRRPSTPGALRRATVAPVLYGGAVVAVLVLGGRSIETIRASFGERGLGDLALVAAWAAVGLAASPFAALFGRSLRRFVSALSEAALPAALRDGATGETARLVLRRTLYFTAVLLLAVLLVVVASPFAPEVPILLAAAVAVAGSVVLLGSALVRFQRRVDRLVEGVVEGEEREHLLQLVRELHPWAPEMREAEVASGSAADGRALADLALRAETGATVLALDRDGARRLNPDPRTPLRAGDRVVLVGEAPQVEAAERVLAGPVDAAPEVPVAQLEEIRVAEGSPLAGATLAEARLREATGASVVAVLRAGEAPAVSPPSDLRLAVGDVLVVAGTDEERGRVRERAGG